MTLRAKLGLVTGTRDAPSQFLTVFDTANGDVNYQDALTLALASVPASLFGALPDAATIQITERSQSAIHFSVGYSRRGQSIILRRVNAQTKAKKIYHFLEAGNVYGNSGENITSDYSKIKWKLDRQSAATEFNSGKPLAVEPLSASRTVTYKTRRALITDAYLDAVEGMVTRGVFNDDTYWGRAAKSLQLVGFGVNEREGGDWELEYSFGYQAIQTDVEVGDGVKIPTLYGNQFYWLIEKTVYADTELQPKVVGAVAGDVWPTGSFTDLKLPWQGSLTTRTSDTAGVVTTTYDHNITGGGTVVLFWNGGFMEAAITSVTSSTVHFTGGTGDALPLLNTNLCIAKNS